MDKRRVALFCSRQLLSESLEYILGELEDVTVLGPWELNKRVLSHLAACTPDVVLLVAPETLPGYGASITGRILEQFPHLPVIHIHLESNVVHLYSSQTLPARRANLVGLIRNLPMTGKNNE